jgi:hypothetical protein
LAIHFDPSLDNLTNRDCDETQNNFESRVTPDAPSIARIHGTFGYLLTAIAWSHYALRREVACRHLPTLACILGT